MANLRPLKMACTIFLLCAATAIASGQTVTTLVNFLVQKNGAFPGAAPTQGIDGNLYGTTTQGGMPCWRPGGCGEVYKLSPAGLQQVYTFCQQPNCSDGDYPAGTLGQNIDGTLYGTTEEGGANGGGSVFKITAGGELTTLYGFCSQTNCNDGVYPSTGLVQGANGNFYGTT
jgi:uncharacterized repeat protein (TIGR03803 family)